MDDQSGGKNSLATWEVLDKVLGDIRSRLDDLGERVDGLDLRAESRSTQLHQLRNRVAFLEAQPTQARDDVVELFPHPWVQVPFARALAWMGEGKTASRTIDGVRAEYRLRDRGFEWMWWTPTGARSEWRVSIITVQEATRCDWWIYDPKGGG